MRAFEQLLEAVEYSREIEVPWPSQFSNLSEARTILTKAERQSTDEYDIANLSIAMGEEPPEVVEEIGRVKKRCFLKLRRVLRSIC
jgi:hypothetical protein